MEWVRPGSVTLSLANPLCDGSEEAAGPWNSARPHEHRGPRISVNLVFAGFPKVVERPRVGRPARPYPWHQTKTVSQIWTLSTGGSVETGAVHFPRAGFFFFTDSPRKRPPPRTYAGGFRG